MPAVADGLPRTQRGARLDVDPHLLDLRGLGFMDKGWGVKSASPFDLRELKKRDERAAQHGGRGGGRRRRKREGAGGRGMCPAEAGLLRTHLEQVRGDDIGHGARVVQRRMLEGEDLRAAPGRGEREVVSMHIPEPAALLGSSI